MSNIRSHVSRVLMDRLDWNLLRTYLTIMQERSISRAAARLHLTQPAVSQALKRLEDSLGRTLIQRRGAQFQPTRAGEEVYRIATDIYGHMSRLDNELDDAAAADRLRAPVVREPRRIARLRRVSRRVPPHLSARRLARRSDALRGYSLFLIAKNRDLRTRIMPNAGR